MRQLTKFQKIAIKSAVTECASTDSILRWVRTSDFDASINFPTTELLAAFPVLPGNNTIRFSQVFPADRGMLLTAAERYIELLRPSKPVVTKKKRGLSEDQVRAIVGIYEELKDTDYMPKGAHAAAKRILDREECYITYQQVLSPGARDSKPLNDVIAGVTFYSVLNVLRRHIVKPKYKYNRGEMSLTTL
jgi:hypothetical protein